MLDFLTVKALGRWEKLTDNFTVGLEVVAVAAVGSLTGSDVGILVALDMSDTVEFLTTSDDLSTGDGDGHRGQESELVEHHLE